MTLGFGGIYGGIGQIGVQMKAPVVAWTPASVSGLKVWFDTSDIDTMFTDAGTTKVSTDGQMIYQLNDKSGLNNHAQQTTEAKRPLYKVNIQNSLSTVYFDGSNDSMIVPALTLTNYSVFLAYKYVARGAVTATAFAWDNYATSPRQALMHFAIRNDQIDYEAYVAGTGGLVVNQGTPNDASAYLADYVRTGTALAFNINASAKTGLTVGAGEFTQVGHRLGTHYYSGADQNQYFKGYICEYLIYDSALSAGDITAARTYLNTKWSIY